MNKSQLCDQKRPGKRTNRVAKDGLDVVRRGTEWRLPLLDCLTPSAAGTARTGGRGVLDDVGKIMRQGHVWRLLNHRGGWEALLTLIEGRRLNDNNCRQKQMVERVTLAQLSG
jgi:hypothetical protein